MARPRENRREALRVPTSPLNPIPIAFELVPGPLGVWQALVIDISVSGIRVHGASPVSPTQGARLIKGTMDWPDIGPVPFQGIIKWAGYGQMGIEFTGMPERIQRLIFQYISKRERELKIRSPELRNADPEWLDHPLREHKSR